MSNRKHKQKAKVEVEVEKAGKITWIRIDGESEIDLADTPNLNKKAEELGWKRK